MGACTECRTAKVKCDQVFPCSRCQRLGKDCHPHVSRQGQNPSRRRQRLDIKRKKSQDDDEEKDDCQIHHRAAGINRAEETDAITCQMLGDPRVTKGHFGLKFLVRQWIALALKRRSFKLLARASTLAVHCGMSMDEILCEEAVLDDSHHESSGSHEDSQTSAPQHPRSQGMDFLYPFLLSPAEDQTVVGRPLAAHEIPTLLWKSMGIINHQEKITGTSCFREFLQEALEHRWIFVREVNKGLSRFYISPGFAKNVVSREIIEETYRANTKDIADLYLVKSDHPTAGKPDFVQGFAHQLALHARPGMVTKPTRFSKVRIRTQTVTTGVTMIQEVDQLWCLLIPNIDQSFGVTELIPPSNSSSSRITNDNDDDKGRRQERVPSTTPTIVEERVEEESSDQNISEFDEDLFVNIDDVDEEDYELKMIYDLLTSS